MKHYVIRDLAVQHCCAYWNETERAYLELETATVYGETAMRALDMTTFKGNAAPMALPSCMQPSLLQPEHLAIVATAGADLARRLPFIPANEIGITIAAETLDALVDGASPPTDQGLVEAGVASIAAFQRIADVAHVLHREFGIEVDEETRIDDVVAPHRPDETVLKALSHGMGVDASGIDLAQVGTVAGLAAAIGALPPLEFDADPGTE